MVIIRTRIRSTWMPTGSMRRTGSITKLTGASLRAAAFEVIPVEAHSGAMGGSQSMEFMVASDAGEDLVVNCPACGYAANLEKGDFCARRACHSRS